MTATIHALAIDLGAESGRVVLGRFDGTRLTIEETHRFANTPVWLLDHLHWDVLQLFNEIKRGLRKSVAEHHLKAVSLGVDAWGVDFALLDRQGSLLGNPYHYRDPWTAGALEAACKRVPREQIFAQTGVQFLPFNTLYQLLALEQQDAPILAQAERLLMIPDLFNYWLTGRQTNERTIASTSQCLDPNTGTWARGLLAELSVPTKMFADLIEPATVLGPLSPTGDETLDRGHIQAIAPGCHDTACAVAAVPTNKKNHAYLSSGTWSLMGVEVEAPVIDEKTLRYNFTNEAGVGHTVRLLRNMTGMWLLQECQRAWRVQGKALAYEDMVELARQAPAFGALIDPEDEAFLAPGNMPERVRARCKKGGQSLTADKGVIVRTILESLALRYRWTLEKVEDILGHRCPVLHVVGGGSQNRLLNQFTADAIGRPVVAGPVEATAIGNVLMQLLAQGHIGSLQEGREVVRRSFATTTYEPQAPVRWDEAYERFVTLLDR